MRQAGLNPLPPATGAEFVTPGPRTHDGLLFDAQDPAETARTLALVNRMKDDLVSSDMESPQDELARTWHDDMIWFGPAGIGSAYTRGRYQEQHQGPFSEGLEDITFHGHVCRFAEGKYAGWFGWPNLTMKARGSFLGMPACDQEGGDARGRHVPPGGRQAGGELGLHRPAVLPEAAGARRPGTDERT